MLVSVFSFLIFQFLIFEATRWGGLQSGRCVKAAVDKYVTDDGTIVGYKSDGLTLDDIEMGRAVLFVYRVTQQVKYYKAAKFLED
jgi:hypothetical protein